MWLFRFLILAGYALYKGELWGIFLSLFFQIIQIPAFALPSLSYQFFAGACLYIGLETTALGSRIALNLSILSSGYNYSLSKVPEMQYIRLNFVAIALTVVFIIFLVNRLAQAKITRQPFDDLTREPREVKDDIQSYQEALKVYTKEEFLEVYRIIEENIKNVYEL